MHIKYCGTCGKELRLLKAEERPVFCCNKCLEEWKASKPKTH